MRVRAGAGAESQLVGTRRAPPTAASDRGVTPFSLAADTCHASASHRLSIYHMHYMRSLVPQA